MGVECVGQGGRPGRGLLRVAWTLPGLDLRIRGGRHGLVPIIAGLGLVGHLGKARGLKASASVGGDLAFGDGAGVVVPTRGRGLLCVEVGAVFLEHAARCRGLRVCDSAVRSES
jgi:hypothetical protein